MPVIERNVMDFYDWLRIAVPAVVPVAGILLAYLDLRARQKKQTSATQETVGSAVGSGVKEVDLRVELAMQQLTNRITADFGDKHQENLKHFDAIGEQLRSAISSGDEKIDEKIDRTYRDFGETMAAQRERINQFEIYVRENYVSKRDLETQLVAINANTREINSKLSAMQTHIAVMRASIGRGRRRQQDEGNDDNGNTGG